MLLFKTAFLTDKTNRNNCFSRSNMVKRKNRMQIKSRFAFALLVAIIVSLGSVVFANAPGPAGSVIVNVEDLPTTVAYVDILVKISENDDIYVKCNDWITTAAWLDANSSMVRYDAGGYRSYSAHVKGAEPLMNLLAGTPITSYEVRFWENRLGSMEEIFPYIKIALIDQSGAIVQVSPAINVNPFRNVFHGMITLNAKTGRINVDQSLNIFGLILYLIGYLFIPWAITVGIETTIGFLLLIRPIDYVFVVNSISNLTMNGLIFLALVIINRAFLPIPVLVLIELGVVVCEYLAYRKKYLNIPNHQLLAFSIVANALSLMIGLWLNSKFFNVWGL